MEEANYSCETDFNEVVSLTESDPRWQKEFDRLANIDLGQLRSQHPFNAKTVLEMRGHNYMAGLGDIHLHDQLNEILGWVGEARGRLARVEDAIRQFRQDLVDYGPRNVARSVGPVVARPTQSEECGYLDCSDSQDEYWPS